MGLFNQINVVSKREAQSGSFPNPNLLLYDGAPIEASPKSEIDDEFATTTWDLQSFLIYDGLDIDVAPANEIDGEFAGTNWANKVGEISKDIQSSSLDYKNWEINTTNWGVAGPIIPITAKDIESKELNYVGYDLNSTTWGVDGPTIQITFKDVETRELDNQNYELNSTTWV